MIALILAALCGLLVLDVYFVLKISGVYGQHPKWESRYNWLYARPPFLHAVELLTALVVPFVCVFGSYAAILYWIGVRT